MNSQPTVGQDVHYYPSTSADSHRDAPLAAKIAHVWSATCVNLAVFNANGQLYTEECTTSVPLVDPTMDKPDGFYCEYPPVQSFELVVDELKPLDARLDHFSPGQARLTAWDFRLQEKVSLASGETGIVVARSESIRTNLVYHVQYKNAVGCQVEDWFYATDLTSVEEKPQEDVTEPQASQEVPESKSPVPAWKQ